MNGTGPLGLTGSRAGGSLWPCGICLLPVCPARSWAWSERSLAAILKAPRTWPGNGVAGRQWSRRAIPRQCRSEDTLKGLHRLSHSRRSIPHIPFVVCEFVPLQQRPGLILKGKLEVVLLLVGDVVSAATGWAPGAAIISPVWSRWPGGTGSLLPRTGARWGPQRPQPRRRY